MSKENLSTFQTGNQTNSQECFKEAKKVLVGGVNSPVRAFKSVDSTPIFISHGEGAYLISEDGKKYLDYVLAFGPNILGHANPTITKTIQKTVEKGTAFGAPTTAETTLVQNIQKFYPNLEKIRLVNSGTEATMSAIRIARGVTNKTKIIKFDGCYHGHEDGLLVKTGSGALTLGEPDSAGVPDSIAKNTISLPYNDFESINKTFKTYQNEIAAIIVEPVCGNMGLVKPKEGFLRHLRKSCEENKALLIFDEVMIGFRAGIKGIQEKENIKADITCLGKVIGGGLPCGAYGASEKIMSFLAPEGPVYQAGTLSGNPIVTASGVAMLYKLAQEKTQEKLQKNMSLLKEKLTAVINKYDAPIRLETYGTLFTLFFTREEINCLEDVQKTDINMFKKFHKHMLETGIYFAPSPYETAFISTEHDDITTEKLALALEIFLQKDFQKC